MSGFDTLGDYAIAAIPDYLWNSTVNSYASNGIWNWSDLKQVLPKHVCTTRIASIKPPSDGVEDLPCWKHSSDGLFSIKSACIAQYEAGAIFPQSRGPL